jgi:antiviral helicase SLH1
MDHRQGKTDVAMLSILRVLDQHRSAAPLNVPLRSTIRKDDFKIIYVYVEKPDYSPLAVPKPRWPFFPSAPMKALASEIVRKLGKRLQWLGIQVRELTGAFSRIVMFNYTSDFASQVIRN